MARRCSLVILAVLYLAAAASAVSHATFSAPRPRMVPCISVSYSVHDAHH